MEKSASDWSKSRCITQNTLGLVATQIYFKFSPLFREDFQSDYYFSIGLVQPPTRNVLVPTHLPPLLGFPASPWSHQPEADTVGIFSEVQEHVRSKADVVIFETQRGAFCWKDRGFSYQFLVFNFNFVEKCRELVPLKHFLGASCFCCFCLRKQKRGRWTVWWMFSEIGSIPQKMQGEIFQILKHQQN